MQYVTFDETRIFLFVFFFYPIYIYYNNIRVRHVRIYNIIISITRFPWPKNDIGRTFFFALGPKL